MITGRNRRLMFAQKLLLSKGRVALSEFLYLLIFGGQIFWQTFLNFQFLVLVTLRKFAVPKRLWLTATSVITRWGKWLFFSCYIRKNKTFSCKRMEHWLMWQCLGNPGLHQFRRKTCFSSSTLQSASCSIPLLLWNVLLNTWFSSYT